MSLLRRLLGLKPRDLATPPRGAGDRLPGGQRFTKGDLLTFEMVVTADGMVSRFVDNYAVGQASEEQKQAYDVLVEAFNACVELCRPGVNTDVLERAAEQAIRRRGLAEYGFWNHAEPLVWWGMAAQTWQGVPLCSSIALPGEIVVSIEPSICRSGLGARLLRMDQQTVRDDVFKVGRMVIVTQTGCTLPVGSPPATLQTM